MNVGRFEALSAGPSQPGPLSGRRAHALAGVVAEPVFAEWLMLPQEVTDELGRSLGIAYFPLGHLGHLSGLLVTRVLG
jgi:hypothetical protein